MISYYIIFFLSALSSAQRRLSNTLLNFKFECIGNQQTDDEIIIAGYDLHTINFLDYKGHCKINGGYRKMRLMNIDYLFRSLKEFGRLISAIEDEKERMLDQAQQFIIPLENFRKVYFLGTPGKVGHKI